MLCVHRPITHTSEANSLLAAASFRSWVVILISCYTASQEQRDRSYHPPCTRGKQGAEHNTPVVNHNRKGEGHHRQHTQSGIQLRGSRNTGKLNAQRGGPQWGQCRASVDVCLGKSKGEREQHHKGQDFTLASSQSSSSNGAEATARNHRRWLCRKFAYKLFSPPR